MTSPPRKPLSRPRRFLRHSLLILVPAILIPVSIATYRRTSGNLGEVEPGRLYRSAQISDSHLRQLIQTHNLRTIINLRGPNPDQDWYQRELATTLDSGATQIDIPLASDLWLSREQARTLLETLDTASYPALIHCEFGAERTGLVAALARLLQPGSTLQDGYDQFSPRYLFIALKDGRTMIGHLDRYSAWLTAEHLQHTPTNLRSWLLDHYTPASPSREEWPCNPYPRKVTIARSPDGSLHHDEQWSPNACPKTVATHAQNEPTTR